jgi:drug/metabolite transporter (DMT)-like permease
VSVATIAMLLASCLLAAIGQLLFRTGAAGRTGIAEFLNPALLAGLAAYAASTVLWVVALSRAQLALVYPFTLLTFVLVGMGAVFVLGETVNRVVLLGWIVIVVCVRLLWSRSAPGSPVRAAAAVRRSHAT